MEEMLQLSPDVVQQCMDETINEFVDQILAKMSTADLARALADEDSEV